MSLGAPAGEGRELARAKVFLLVHDIQAREPNALGELDRLYEQAKGNGWDDVERACLFGKVVATWFARGHGLAAAIEALLRRSESDGDRVMMALALAMRADGSPTGDGPFITPNPDADLARAVVMLEDAEAGVLERISAHTACGIAFGNRQLWELGAEQYAMALAIGAREPPGSLDFILAPVAFNRCEDQVAWAAALRQLGHSDTVAKRRHAWAVASAGLSVFEMPGAWLSELAALGVLLDAIAGEDVAGRCMDALAAVPAGNVPGQSAEPRTAGHLALALALSEANAGRPGALEAAAAAVSAIVPDDFPQFYDLALCLAAELEAERGATAGLRYARRQFAHHWAMRVARLAAMRGRIEAERLATEHRHLARQVNLDPLTGIGNRRALSRYFEQLRQSDEKSVALIFTDLDDFKEINDRFGHTVGDAVLIRVARLLEHNMRPADLAVRLGGDEFAMMLAGVEVEVAKARAESLLAQVDGEPWRDVHEGLRVTLSIGVAGGTVTDMDQVTSSADAALYRAKGAGGHRVVCSRPSRT